MLKLGGMWARGEYAAEDGGWIKGEDGGWIREGGFGDRGGG